MNKWAIYAAAATTAVALTACGGGGGDSDKGPTPNPEPPVVTTTAEGFWEGKSAAGYDVALAVLENGETWGIYSKNGALYGALHGSTNSKDGKLTGSGNDFDLLSGAVRSSSYSGTYTAKTSLQAQMGGATFSGSYDANYDKPASLSTLTGAYRGAGAATNAGTQSLSVTIASSGAISVSESLGCSASGTVQPRASGKNVFDLSIKFSGTSCALGDGATATGVGYYQSGAFLAMGLLPNKTQGFIFVGSK